MGPLSRRLCTGLATLLAAMCAHADPERALLRESELRGWDVVAEAAADPSADPDLAAWGVEAQHVRHYTREHRGAVEVCSVEIWRFASDAQADAAARGFAYPDWRIDRVGTSLVMVRGLIHARGAAPVRGVFPECDGIGARIRARLG